MSVNFELFEVKTQDTQEILFSAYARDAKAYRVIVDITGRFKKKFIRIMEGSYKHTYTNNQTEATHEYVIDGDDPIENLRKYSQDCPSFSHTVAEVSPSNIRHQFTLHFTGSDYNMEKGMEPRAAHKAYDFFYELAKISQMRVSANNYIDQKPQEFTTAEAASLKLEMYSSVEMTDFKFVLKKILQDIENGVLSTEASIGNRFAMYKRIFKEFSSLGGFKNLDELTVMVDGDDTNITDFKAISELSSDMYGDTASGEMIIQSVHDYYRGEDLDGLVVDTLNFSKITTWKYPKSEALSKLLHKAKGERVKLHGATASETIRYLGSIEFMRDDFVILEEERASVISDGFTFIDKKISIASEGAV